MTPKAVQLLCAVLLLSWLSEVRGVRLAEQKCQEYKNIIASLNPVQVNRVNEFVSQTNGIPAQEGEFPHQARVGQWFYEDEDDVAFVVRCSGALISERYILLAGHCLWSLGDDMVSLGRHDFTRNASLPEMTIQRDDLILHPDYKQETKNSYDDIALLRLKEPVNFTSSVYPACLWTGEGSYKVNQFIATAFTMGKQVNDTEDTYVAKLLVNGVPSEDCAKEYANSTFYQKGITDDQVCVESPVEWNATCQGDLGGLLQTLEQDSTTVYRLYGVEGNGHACEENHLRFTYTRVQSYLDWIEQIVWGV